MEKKKVKSKKARSNKSNPKRLKPDSYFYAQNGVVIKNIKQLAKEIKDMDFETFYHHVNEQKNDFANWIIWVLEEKKLGEELLKTKEKDRIELLLLRKLYY